MYSVHSDYAKLLPRYQTIRDCINDDVVSNSTRQAPYLIQTPGMSDDSYKILKQLGRFMNITGSTLDAMMGLSNKTAPVIILPKAIDYLLINADGEGNGLASLTKDNMADTTSLGRYAMLVEPPAARYNDDGVIIQSSNADVKAGKVRTTIKPYSAESVIDYELSIINDVKKLSLVKLEETITTRDPNTFQTEQDVQYRFLILTDEGYEQRVYEDADGGSPVDEPLIVTDYNGARMDYIPFYFSGSRNNDATADNPPFYKLADKNIALYNSDANNRLNLQLYATGTLIVTGNAQELGKKNLSVGGGGGIYLGETGSANILQLEAGLALPEAIKVEKADMVELGAKLSAPTVARTLGEAEITATQEMALLSTVTGNVEEMTKSVLNTVHLLQTGKEISDFEFTLNRKFFTRPMTAQDRQAWVQEITMGISPKSLYYKRLRESGDYPEDFTDEDIAADIEPQDGLT